MVFSSIAGAFIGFIIGSIVTFGLYATKGGVSNREHSMANAVGELLFCGGALALIGGFACATGGAIIFPMIF